MLLLSTALKKKVKMEIFSPKLRPGFPVTGPKCQLMNNSGTEEVFIGTGPDGSAQKEDFSKMMQNTGEETDLGSHTHMWFW